MPLRRDPPTTPSFTMLARVKSIPMASAAIDCLTEACSAVSNESVRGMGAYEAEWGAALTGAAEPAVDLAGKSAAPSADEIEVIDALCESDAWRCGRTKPSAAETAGRASAICGVPPAEPATRLMPEIVRKRP